MAVGKGQRRRFPVSLKTLHSILPSLPDATIRRIQQTLGVVAETARRELSSTEVRANAEPVIWVQEQCRTLASALKEAERVLGATPGFILNTVCGVTDWEEPRHQTRWMAELRALRLAAERLGRPKKPKGGAPQDHQGLGIALGVFTVLAEEGIVTRGPSRGKTNPWTQLTALLLSQVKGTPVQRVDRLLQNAAQCLSEWGYVTPRPTRHARKAMPKKTKAEYQRWKKLDSYLKANDESMPERNEAIAERFRVPADEVRRARKRGRL